MTPIQTAIEHMTALKNEALAFEQGRVPDVEKVIVHYAYLMQAYADLSGMYSEMYKNHQVAYIRRRRERALEYGKLRKKKEYTAKDAEMASMMETSELYDEEVQAEATLEEYKTFLRSIERAIDFARSLSSFLQKQ